MGNFVTWGVVGLLAGIAVSSGVVAWIKDPSRPERLRKRRAAKNQAWVRNRIAQHNDGGVMSASINREAQTIARFRAQLEDPWTHLESKS
jgi:hypothetical protein